MTNVNKYLVFFYLSVLASGTAMHHVDSSDTHGNIQQVHVLFRHGDRTNIENAEYPTDPFKNVTYYPYGRGQLTQKGKRREFLVGKLLRKRYDRFLGKLYMPHIVDAWSSEVNRTKTSLELVLAGLFPPSGEQVWNNDLPWQPIPYNYLPKELDKMFYGAFCPNYQRAFKQYKQSPEYQNHVIERNKDLFNYLTNKTGKEILDDVDVYKLYMNLKVELENGLKLPHWTESVYPEPLQTIAANSYVSETATTQLKKLGSGYLLRKIIDDSTSLTKHPNSTSNTKIFLYSGHEFNLAFFLNTLGLFEPHLPPYGAHILVELHKINEEYGFKIYYHDYTSENAHLLKLSQCKEFCPLNQFRALYEDFIPNDNDCGR